MMGRKNVGLVSGRTSCYKWCSNPGKQTPVIRSRSSGTIRDKSQEDQWMKEVWREFDASLGILCKVVRHRLRELLGQSNPWKMFQGLPQEIARQNTQHQTNYFADMLETFGRSHKQQNVVYKAKIWQTWAPISQVQSILKHHIANPPSLIAVLNKISDGLIHTLFARQPWCKIHRSHPIVHWFARSGLNTSIATTKQEEPKRL